MGTADNQLQAQILSFLFFHVLGFMLLGWAMSPCMVHRKLVLLSTLTLKRRWWTTRLWRIGFIAIFAQVPAVLLRAKQGQS